MKYLVKIFFFLVFIIRFSWPLSGQWEIIINQFPSSTPEDGPIYIAGNFNNWNPKHNNYQLQKNAEGHWTISLPLSPGTYQYKFTRGSWNTVEGTADGKVIANRTYQYPGGKQTLFLKIEGWEDVAPDVSTASPSVSILSENFYMPQFNKYRKIWLYLPKDYQTSEKRYPVIYMHDGQNLFDKSTSYAGEWKVDESLDSLFAEQDFGCIIVGIENGEADRIREYTPWPHPSYGGGKGNEYVRFIEETLKPHVDANYRTRTEKKYTGIAGSSLGGLISHYAGLEFQETFGRIGSLSTSYWFSDSLYTLASKTGISPETRFYLSSGTSESNQQVSQMLRMADTLSKYGLDETELHVSIVTGGKHNEANWAGVFPKMYQWFWHDELFSSSVEQDEGITYSIYRQGDTIRVNCSPCDRKFYVLHNLGGSELQRGDLEEMIIITNRKEVNPLILSIFQEGVLIFSQVVP